MTSRFVAAPPDLQEVAGRRLKGILALVRNAPGWLTRQDFVEDPALPIASLDGARQLAVAARELCGLPLEIELKPVEPAYATAHVRGPRATVLVGCRIERSHPHRIDELVLLPASGRPGARPLPPAPATTRSTTRPSLDGELEDWLGAVRTDFNQVGLVAAVYDGPEMIWSGAAGTVGVDDERAPDPASTVVRIGSITKTMLTVRCLQLVEEGALGLHDRVQHRLTSWPIAGPHAGELEVAHLLSHTGGTREVAEDRYFLPQDGPEPELDNWLDRPVEIVNRPGQAWSYSNVGMTLVGQLISEVTGRDFEDDVRDHVFAPLGMTDTKFRIEPERRPAVMSACVEGYDGVAEIPPVHVGARAAGSVFSTIADVGLWAGEVVAGARGTGVLLSPSSWEDCLSPTVAVPGTGLAMARGFLRVDDPDEPVVWHNGALPGAAAQLWIAPRSGLSLAVFSNVWSPWRTMVLERRCLHLLQRLASASR